MMNDSSTARTLGPIGLWSPEFRSSPDAPDAAAELDELGWGALWMPGSGRRSIWADAESLLEAAPTVTVAFGVLSIWSPDADIASAAFARLTARHGERILPGFGVSTAATAGAQGKRYTTPLRGMNEYFDTLDAAPQGIQRQNRLVGALGPKMTELGGRRAAGVHSFLATTEGTAHNRELLGSGPLLAPYLPVSLEEDPDSARNAIRSFVSMFIGFPTYQANLRRLGFTPDDVASGGSDRLIDAVSAWGSLESVEARIRAYLDAGATHVPLHFVGSGRSLPLRQWREATPLLRSFAEAPTQS